MPRLVISRKPGQSLRIGANIVIHFREVTAGRVKIAIEAPREVAVVRSELAEKAAA